MYGKVGISTIYPAGGKGKTARAHARAYSPYPAAPIGAKKGEETAKPEQIRTDKRRTEKRRGRVMRTYIPAPWDGGDGRRAGGQPATAPCDVRRAELRKLAAARRISLKNSAFIAGFFTALFSAKIGLLTQKIRSEPGQRRREWNK